MIRTGNKKISLAAYMNFLSIVGAGEVTWNQVVDAGYDTIDKINAMSIEEISNIGASEGHRVGEKTAQKIWDCLHSERVQQLLKFSDLWIEKDQIQMKDSLKIEIEENESELKMDLWGKKVLFTGEGCFPRNVLTAVLKRNGVIVQTSLTKETDVLILADLNSTSNKAKKARKYGTKMVTYGDVFKE